LPTAAALVENGVRTLLRIEVHPLVAPWVWEALPRLGPDLTVVVNVDAGPGSGRDPSYTAVTGRLAAAGVNLLGYVDLGYATRPVRQVRTDVGRWAGYPVHGVFLDRAAVSPFSIGPAAVAVQAARRVGLDRAVLNPGAPPDPVYRDLGVPICVFDGGWEQYRDWSGAGAEPGDGHLVHGVPADDLPAAHRLAGARGAGFGCLTDAAPPFTHLPAWSGLELAR
jgi:hypothetical protein